MMRRTIIKSALLMAAAGALHSPGAAAHRKRARFNDGGHHVARSAVATAP